MSIIDKYLIFQKQNSGTEQMEQFYLKYEFCQFQSLKSQINHDKIIGFCLTYQERGIEIIYQCSAAIQQSENDQKVLLKQLKAHTIKNFRLSSFNFLETLGEGLTSKVYKVSHLKKDNNIFALKVINKIQIDEDLQQSLIDEVKILRKLRNCQNVNRLYKIYETSNNLYLLLEYKEGGDLKRGIIHRDLKPDNILLNQKQRVENDITLADFGFAVDISKKYPDEALICGTAGYFAPEILQGQRYSNKSDIFSTGCILYMLMTNKSLFTGQHQREILLKNKRCLFSSNMNEEIKKYSNDLQDLLNRLLICDQNLRPNAADALSHKLFDEIEEGIKESLILNSIDLEVANSEMVRQKLYDISIFNQHKLLENLETNDLWKIEGQKDPTGITSPELIHQNYITRQNNNNNCFGSPSSYLQIIKNSQRIRDVRNLDIAGLKSSVLVTPQKQKVVSC
ncbi:serine threonine protein kinase [Stylonychia lemnae]|uniref:Serine threonine protein kinase n=1 Tax=Stylonychia lemnae TaxID=5949 RepID=A0A078B308_STYLE|nr:serine threonine protein kinase [Stylonychia lemnae]|eukprot:CDW88890.1 serine threonine protein kinase [Stylonychia lemnae]